ncbi:hypothetical protein [Mucilaginibacter flavus]|uniref:hypothetical protein n=1 Tax=Mucilaginibacter flavus TaxID=931504 RepID=UPI0025B37EDD|nr:hypothetical protein [Mucilaginibacter flavus]MDN3583023.1 hypothetical protein [Mucilaginibacter flavus]
MELRDDETREEKVLQNEQTQGKPNAYQIDDDSNLTEEDLQRGFFTSKEDMKKQDAPGMEGHGMGGQNFGENNLTPSGNDPANPSQMAGDNNEYFRRTQPAEEHPENNNFKDPKQLGQSNYSGTMTASQNGRSDEDSGETTASDDEKQPDPQTQQPYQEGTADDDGKTSDDQPNIPGPNEVPDQQKVGE